MLLTAPRSLSRTDSRGLPPAGIATDDGTGRELLALLRGASPVTAHGAGDRAAAARPRFDPGLAGGLRAWLEDAAYDVVARRGDDAPRLVLGARRLLGAEEAGRAEAPPAGDPVADGPTPGDVMAGGLTEPDAALVARLVHVLFRQLVHGGAGGDPLADALDALRAAGAGAPVRRIESLPAPARAALATALARHAANLRVLVPRFAPGWMPRTDDHVAVPLAGGRVVLSGTFDLLVGAPHPGTASLCALGLSTGGPWPRERRTLHFLALLEALRSGTPPFRLALIESASRRYGVEDVREEHLRAITSHIVAWLAEEASSRLDEPRRTATDA